MTGIDHFAVLSSLVAGELARIRNYSTLEAQSALGKMNPGTEIGGGEFNTDSLELLELASAVTQMFHLHETGVEEYLLRHRTLGNWAEIVSFSQEKKADHLTFRTSGSTGKPKGCVHRIADLERETAVHSASHRHCKRILAVVPRHHIYGFLWTVMLPLKLGVDVIDARRWTSSRVGEALREGDLLVGTPAQWRFLSDGIESFPAGVCGITSGAPCPMHLFGELERREVGMTEVYGSSETGGIGTRSASRDSFGLLPFWRRGEAENSLLRLGLNAEDPPDLLDAPDHLEWADEEHFVVGARRDGAVQVRGINVFTGRIVETIRSHPAVEECAVRLMRPREGDRLKAFIVFRQGGVPNADVEEIEHWIQERLSPPERPASITTGSTLPRNEMGKPADWDCRC
jgi:long-chain acyl-CoA synthetase